MLTKEDLQAIGELIAASEERMTGRIAESEERMTGRITASEERTKTSIMAYIENDVKKDICKIADGHKMLADKMDRMEKKIDKLQDDVEGIKGELTTQEMVITRRFRVE